MTRNKLVIRGLYKTYPGKGTSAVQALRDISLTVREGEFVSLIGPSGSGKSSLLDIIAGLSLPDEGELTLDGMPLAGKRGRVSYMPQRDVLFPWRTILDNVIVPLQIQGVKRQAAREEAARLLPVFGLEQFADSYPHMLSGGMRQRAAFLRTYLCKRELMLLDEPFASLDALTRMQMHQWLLSMWQRFRHSVLLVTHDVDEAILLSDRIYLLSPRPGEIVAEVAVPLPRPRHPHMTTDPDFLQTKAKLLGLLQETVFSKTPAQ
ncbi:MAG: ABC transporter ATP-binding protein [Brevibacillus sp.]|nr:ABC transporter ATP-binding protein [Brevibacillus sp.]